MDAALLKEVNAKIERMKTNIKNLYYQLKWAQVEAGNMDYFQAIMRAGKIRTENSIFKIVAIVGNTIA